MKVYSWGFFYEDGDKTYLQLPFGPEGGNHDRIWHDVDDPRFDEVEKVYPDIREILRNDKDWFMVIVNPPDDAPDDFEWPEEVKKYLLNNFS